MANPQAVRALLKDLKRVGSPVQRVKLLALAWRTVRELSPEERSEIASELGMKELSGLMERLGRKKDGVAPAEVLQALEQVDELDPKKVSTVLAGLWARGTRKEAVRDGLEMLGRMFDEPEPEPEIDEEAAELSPEADLPVIEVEEPVVETFVIEPVIAEPEIAVGEPDPPPPSSPEPPALAIAEPPAVIDAAPEPERPVEKSVVPPPGSPVAMLESAPSPAKRFRIVRELFAGGAGVDEDSLEALVARFPDGWQRRRVLCMLFRNGLPASTGRALEMIGALERSVDRRWCAATLADTRDLTPAEIDELLGMFPFRGLDRRLRPVRETG